MVWTSPRRKPATKRRCLVTGGSGFVGRHLVSQLLDSGRWDVTVFDVRAVEGEEWAKYIVGDLRNAQQVADACQGESSRRRWPGQLAVPQPRRSGVVGGYGSRPEPPWATPVRPHAIRCPCRHGHSVPCGHCRPHRTQQPERGSHEGRQCRWHAGGMMRGGDGLSRWQHRQQHRHHLAATGGVAAATCTVVQQPAHSPGWLLSRVDQPACVRSLCSVCRM